MSSDIIQQRLETYNCQTQLEEENAIREITQEVALMALSRIGFFSKASFLGGTALRILFGLQRFSEDLDFSLLDTTTPFKLEHYLDNLANEFLSFGYEIEIQDKSRVDQIVKKAFLKDDSIGRLLMMKYPHTERSRKKIRIKLEIDTNPPSGAENEIQYLDFPLPFSITCHNLSSTFAGKLHALLCRSYVKGRDWYDFLWYLQRKITPNYNLLSAALNQQGPWQNQQIEVNESWLMTALEGTIHKLDWTRAINDVARFIKPHEQQSLQYWSSDFFMSRLKRIS